MREGHRRGFRWVHLAVAVVAAFAVVFQLVLVWRGGNVLNQTEPPDLATRLLRFVGYFTILSNLLVAGTSLSLAVDPGRDTLVRRVLRLDAVVGIAVTGLVHWFFLRPLLDLHGADRVADKLLHVVVPVIAVAAWALTGPRGRISPQVVWWSLVFPLAWLGYTLVRGAFVHWYPYPFVDVDRHGYAVVLRNCLGVAVLVLALGAGAYRLDRLLPGDADP